MRRILATIIVACTTLAAPANQILWVGIDENATIDFADGSTKTVAQWVASLPDPEWDAGFKIRDEGGAALPEAFTGETEVGGLWHDEDGSGRWQPFLWQTDVSSLDEDSRVFYDLYQFDYDADDWSFVASASTVLSELGDKTYTTGSIDPNYAVEWKPSHYSAAVPEPNAAMAFVIGASMLLAARRRKH